MLDAIQRTRKRAILTIMAMVGALIGVGLVAPMVANAEEGCEVDYDVVNDWGSGFHVNVGITAGEAINGWTIEWDFTTSVSNVNPWNVSNPSLSGSHFSGSDVGWNGSIASGQTIQAFGFTASGTAGDVTNVKINGVACDGSDNPTSDEPTTDEPTTDDPTTPIGDGNAMEIVEAMQPGWNLGNSLDSVGDDETAWGNPRITQQLIQNIRSQGFNSIRIPVTWDNHQGGAPDYAIDPAYLDRVEEVVDWALDADLYVLINIHHDSWIWMADMNSNRTQVLDRYEVIWNELADRFRDAPQELLFESVNEPQFNNVDDATGNALLDELNTVFHQIVRGSGGGNADRVLVLPTLHTNSEQQYIDALAATIDDLNDPNLAATIHYYGFWPFSVNVAGYTEFDNEVQQDVVDYLGRARDAFVSQDIPVIVGEWGLLGFDAHVGTVEQGEKLKFFEFMGYQAREMNMTLQVWDNGQHFGRTSFQWSDPELYAMMEASWTTRSGTASSDQLYVERSSSITDATLTLNPNGTSFEGLRQGNTDLVQGSDYTVSGNQLTISASKLTELVGSQQYGVNADLHVDFSQGAPWRISVISYDTPVLQNASGSTSGFAIPTQFNGDQLATMEAVYEDGANAGPHDWTSFKEFSRAFEPDYNAGVINLTEDFFAEVNDDRPVNLTFHFWSGDTVTYNITKSGGSVTGSTG